MRTTPSIERANMAAQTEPASNNILLVNQRILTCAKSSSFIVPKKKARVRKSLSHDLWKIFEVMDYSRQ